MRNPRARHRICGVTLHPSAVETCDLAVIGSGFGGLSAAALSGKAGLRTTVFEQHTRPGGCAGDFAMQGFWFPAGATVVTGLEPGGILSQVFGALEIETPGAPLDPSIVLHTEDRSLPYWADLDRWQAEFAGAFPGAPDGYRRFWDWAGDIGGIVYGIGNALPSFPIERLADIRRGLPAIRPRVVRALPLLPNTVADVKRRLGAVGLPAADALIDGLLIDATGATANECSAIQGAIALDIYRRGCQWVPGGTARLAMDLVRSIRNSNGEVRFREPIISIRRKRNGWLLRSASGGATLANAVVANMPPAALEVLMGNAPQSSAERPREDAWGAFLLHLGIDATGLEPLHPFQQVIRDGEESSAEGDNCLVSIFPGRGDREHRWSISVSTHTRAETWWDNSPAQQCRRRALEERLLESVERVIPDVRDRVILQRSATPRTFQRFTGRPGGYVGGLIQRPSNAAFFATSRRPAKGLFLAGDHVFPGQGTVGVALSGINAHRDVAEYLGRRPLL